MAPVAHGSSSHHASGLSRFIPWDFVQKLAPSALLHPDDGTGKRFPVKVKVVDLEGRPQSGVDVEVRADALDYATAGMDDDQYDAWEKAHPDEASQYEGTDYESQWSAVQKGRTDRNGVFLVSVKADVPVVFMAKDGVREGVSRTFTAEDPAEYEGTYEGTSDEEGTSSEAKTDEPPEVEISIAELATLTGSITDESGHPIAGAEVSIQPLQDDYEEVSGEVATDQMVVSHPGSDPFHTGADGTFHMTVRGSGAFDVSVDADGFRRATEPAVQILPARETRVNITLEAAAQLAGTVLDAQGKPLSAITVTAFGSQPDQNASGYTDENGAFKIDQLARGRYTLIAQSTDHRPGVLTDVEAGGRPVEIRLADGGKVHLDVWATTDALSAAGFQPTTTDPVPDQGINRAEVVDTITVTTDDGAPNDEPAESGYAAVVYISASGKTPIPGADARNADEKTRTLLDQQFPPIDQNPRYAGNLYLSTKDGHGTLDLAGLAPGEYDLTVVLGQMASKITGVRVYDGGTATADARLPDPDAASIDGQVAVSDGRKPLGGTVYLIGGLFGEQTAPVDPQGRFHFASVVRGEYTISGEVTVDGLPDGPVASLDSQPVTVRYGGRMPLSLVATAPAQDTTTLTASIDPQSDQVADVTPDVDYEATSDYEGSDYDAMWAPDVRVQPTDNGLVVLRAAPMAGGPRLFGGDRVVSIDGNTLTPDGGAYELMDYLDGDKDTLCTIVVDRPATHETLTVSMPRTVEQEDRYEE